MRSPSRTARLLVVSLFAAGAGLPLRAQPVGGEFRINTYTTSYQYPSAVAMDSAGNFVVVWGSRDQDGSGYGIFGQRYAASGAPLGAEFRVNTSTTGDQLGPAVTSDPAGNFVVVWEQSTPPRAVMGQRYSSSGAPLGTEFQISSYTTGGAYRQLAVTSDASGNFVVVWKDFQADPSFGGILARRYSSSGAPLASEFRVNTITTYHQSNPSVAADAAGNFVVVWHSAQAAGQYIQGQRYASTGAPLGTEFLISTTGTPTQPVVASQPDGGFVTVFQKFVPNLIHLHGRAWSSAGAPLGPDFQISTYATGGARNAKIAAASQGIYVVTWDEDVQSIGNGDVFARRVSASGKALDGVFQANTFSLDNQYAPSVAANPNGNFVVTWTSKLLDFSDTAIIGQRFVSVPLPSGDVNADGFVDVLDVFYLINYLFAGGAYPIGKADVNASTSVDVLDVFYLINYLFAGGPPPQ